MRIKGLKCESLAGVLGKDISFTDGLNVILGPNEAGKSTLVEGLFAAFFRSHRLRMNNSKDKEFYENCRPYPDGNSMSVKVDFNVGDADYEFSKEWGATPSAIMSFNGKRIKEERELDNKIKGFLKYGESTYRNIVFAKQKDLKTALDMILKDEDTSGAVGNILRQAVMALDGLSVEKMKKVLEKRIEDYKSKWDVTNGRPEGGRGIDNPWQKSVGKVLQRYYSKEKVRREIEHAQKAEEDYSIAAERLKEVKIKQAQIKEEINKYSPIEGDVLKRAVLEPQIATNEKDIKELREISKQFPVKEYDLEIKKEELKKLNMKEEKLSQELAVAKKLKDCNEARELLSKIEKNVKEIEIIQFEKGQYIDVTEAVLEKLENLHNIILEAKSKMEAATLLGKLTSTKVDGIFVTRGLEKRETVTCGVEFSASGYLKVEVEDVFELEVKAGEIDFEELKKKYTEAKKEFEEILKSLDVSDLSEAKANYQVVKKLDNNIKVVLEKNKGLLGERDLEALKAIAKEGEPLRASSIEEIEKDKTELNNVISDLKADIKASENTIDGWIKKYESPDKVIDELALMLKKLEENKTALLKLAELPQEFSSVEGYQNRLSELRQSSEDIVEAERTLTKELYDAEKKLPENSSEEIKPLYRITEEGFQKEIAYLHSLLRIKNVFDKKLAEMDKDSFKPLKDAFNKYISSLTLGNYDEGEISDSLEVDIIKKDDTRLPTRLLSSGTYDSVLIALRFALLDYLFNGDEGLVVLDDCLVNLDPNRRKKSAELIKEYAKNNQVIFTTCDPDTATLLGGNIISI